MHVLAVILLVSAPIAEQTKVKAPTKAEQKAAEEAAAKAKAEEEAAAKAAAEKAAADAEAARKSADEAAAKKAVDDAKAAEQAALAARGMDARMRALCDLVALPLKKLPGDHREQRFAVIPFEAVGEEAQQRQLGVVVTDLVVTNLARDHRLPLVERAALAKILDEQALGQSGAVADEQAAKIGVVAGARALIVGNVTDAGDAFRVTVRAIDSETAAVVEGSARDVLLPKEELIAFSTSAVVLKSKSGAMFRSIVLPGWGQVYNDEPIKAGVFGASTGALAVATVTTAAFGAYLGYGVYPEVGFREEDKGVSPDEIQRRVVATRESSDVTLAVSGVLAGLTAAMWGIGAVDAYLSGVDVESLDAALAKN